MSVADDFRAAVKLMSAFPPGNSARSVGVPADAPNYSAKSLSGASFGSGSSGGQNGLSAISQGVNAVSNAVGTVAKIFA